MSGIWGTAGTRSLRAALSIRHQSPRAAGRGCCLFKSLQAAGSRWPGRPGPLVLCVALHKRGGQLGRGWLQQVGGWGLAPPPSNPAATALWGGVFLLGMPLLSKYCGPYSHPQTPRIPSGIVLQVLGKSLIMPGLRNYPLQLQGMSLPSLPPPPGQNL